MNWPPPAVEYGPYRAQFYDGMSNISEPVWNAHNPNAYPFLSHAFLHALETSHSVGREKGMMPMHMQLFQEKESLGFVPLYLKFHSYGEYIFDWEWARGAQAAGIDYYPKLLVGAPYTPAVGHRLLMDQQYFEIAATILKSFCEQLGLSGVHVLHCLPEESQALQKAGYISRETHQYHFHNAGYENFDQFLNGLKSRHRKQIKKERKRATDNALTLDLYRGDTLSQEDWERIYQLYENTYQRKWGTPYLTPNFFKNMPSSVQQTVLAAIARDSDGTIQAMSLSFESDTHLYGRYWGCAHAYDTIHFEFCYYRLIEYAIETGKKVFEAGAQGEHKIKRGFVPVTIHSAHVLTDPRLHNAVAHFCKNESNQEDHIKEFLSQLAPYKKSGEG